MLVEVLPINVDDDLMVKPRIIFDGKVTLVSVPTEKKDNHTQYESNRNSNIKPTKTSFS